MEKQKLKLSDLLHVEFSREYLIKNWPRLSLLLVLLLVILGAAAMVVSKVTQPEPLVRIEVTLKKVCRLGGKVMLEQKVVREVKESQAEKVPKEIIMQDLCDEHLYEMSVREEKMGRSRFHDNVAQARAVGVDYIVRDETGKEKLVSPNEDEMAHRLIKILEGKYPEAEHYDIRVNHIHYDFNRDGVLMKKYD